MTDFKNLEKINSNLQVYLTFIIIFNNCYINLNKFFNIFLELINYNNKK